MTETLPLFPLGTVPFPGLVLPLHIFEDRYRRLVRDLLTEEEPRRFGVVGIELGHEVGHGAARRISAVGCTAEVRRVREHDDGRFDLVTAGGMRFRVEEVDESLPYPRAVVTMLPDEDGPGARTAVPPVSRLFRRYRDRLAEHGARLARPGEPPTDPVPLSYVIAATLLVDRPDKQRLLQAPHAAARLRLEYDLLRRENLLLDRLPSVPAADLLDASVHLS